VAGARRLLENILVGLGCLFRTRSEAGIDQVLSVVDVEHAGRIIAHRLGEVREGVAGAGPDHRLGPESQLPGLLPEDQQVLDVRGGDQHVRLGRLQLQDEGRKIGGPGAVRVPPQQVQADLLDPLLGSVAHGGAVEGILVNDRYF